MRCWPANARPVVCSPPRARTTVCTCWLRSDRTWPTWAHGDAERTQRVLSEHGRQRRRPRRGPQGYGDDLSPRELEVVRLLATGRTNREIANALGLSIRTVDAHVNSAMRKRKVNSRTALAMAAAVAGFVALKPAHGSTGP